MELQIPRGASGFPRTIESGREAATVGCARSFLLIDRYTRPAMGGIWTDENKYRCWLQVEAAASTVLAEFGVIPASAAKDIATKATVSAARVAEIEAEVKHDVIAFTTAVAESLQDQGLDGQSSRWLHYGLTS